MSQSAQAVVNLNEVREIVTSIMSTIKGSLSTADLRFYHELESLSNFIQETRNEILSLQPKDIKDNYIPLATDELSAVVEATEEATGSILDAVEKIEALTPDLPPEQGEIVGNCVTQIYEACNFQDISGQRISKVVKTLQYIEQKVNQMLGAFQQELSSSLEESTKTEKIVDPLNPDSLLNGPQLKSLASSQDDIDALFDKL